MNNDVLCKQCYVMLKTLMYSWMTMNLQAYFYETAAEAVTYFSIPAHVPCTHFRLGLPCNQREAKCGSEIITSASFNSALSESVIFKGSIEVTLLATGRQTRLIPFSSDAVSHSMHTTGLLIL